MVHAATLLWYKHLLGFLEKPPQEHFLM